MYVAIRNPDTQEGRGVPGFPKLLAVAKYGDDADHHHTSNDERVRDILADVESEFHCPSFLVLVVGTA